MALNDAYWLGRYCGLLDAKLTQKELNNPDVWRGLKAGQFIRSRLNNGYYGKYFEEYCGLFREIPRKREAARFYMDEKEKRQYRRSGQMPSQYKPPVKRPRPVPPPLRRGRNSS